MSEGVWPRGGTRWIPAFQTTELVGFARRNRGRISYFCASDDVRDG